MILVDAQVAGSSPLPYANESNCKMFILGVSFLFCGGDMTNADIVVDEIAKGLDRVLSKEEIQLPPESENAPDSAVGSTQYIVTHVRNGQFVETLSVPKT